MVHQKQTKKMGSAQKISGAVTSDAHHHRLRVHLPMLDSSLASPRGVSGHGRRELEKVPSPVPVEHQVLPSPGYSTSGRCQGRLAELEVDFTGFLL